MNRGPFLKVLETCDICDSQASFQNDDLFNKFIIDLNVHVAACS